MKKFPYFLTFSAVLCLLLCVSVGYLISTCIVSSNLFQTTTNVESGEKSYYLISIYQDEIFENCQKVQSEFQNKNCAGYIYQDSEKYHLIASIYSNVNDAELVKSNLKTNGYNAEILEKKIENTKLEGNFTNKETEILKDCFSIKDETYKSLYDISISLDTDVIDEINAKLKVNETFANFVATKNNFETLFSKDESTEISNLRKEFEQIYEYLSNLSNETYENENQTFSSLIKLTYCKIILEN